MKWRPINTAPRDGRGILVTDGKLRAIVVPAPSRWVWVAHSSGKEKCPTVDKDEASIVTNLGKITHWMPLPEPPKAAP